MTTYLPRILDTVLDDLQPHLPAIVIEGAKGVGKTQTAARRVPESGVIRLDDPALLEVVRADPGAVLRQHRPVLIDEWQKYPPVWDYVKRAVDRDPSGGQFILTGSAAQTSELGVHSGAGRITGLRMRPMGLSERGRVDTTVSLVDLAASPGSPVSGTSPFALVDYIEEILASGFPGIRQLPNVRAQRNQLTSYLRHAVDQDIAEAGLKVRRPDAVRAWLRAYSAATGTNAAYSRILASATAGIDDKPSRSATEGYREVLTRTGILDPIPAWDAGENFHTRLAQAPTHHLADPALAAVLLGLNQAKLVAGAGPGTGAFVGHLFESLAVLTVRVLAELLEDASIYHFRTNNGDHEVDIIIELANNDVIAIEAKLASVVTDADVKHLNWLKERVGDRLIERIVVHTGPVAYRRPDGVGVVPLALLGG